MQYPLYPPSKLMLKFPFSRARDFSLVLPTCSSSVFAIIISVSFWAAAIFKLDVAANNIMKIVIRSFFNYFTSYGFGIIGIVSGGYIKFK